MGSQWLGSAETWTCVLLLLALVLLYDYRCRTLLRSFGIPGPTPLPIFGTVFEYRKGFHGFDMECFRKYGRVWAIYDVRQPVICVMDKEVIKCVLVKDCYSLFTNRRDFALNGELYDALSVVTDNDWRRIRSILSPSFTSGRLKEVYVWHHEEAYRHFIKKPSEDCRTSLQNRTVDIKGVFGPYSMDVVTSTAFSVDIDSLNNPNDPFVTNVKKLTLNFLSPVFLLAVLFPFTIPLLEKMNYSFFPLSVIDFFINVLKKIKADRQHKDHRSRVDFLQLMMDSQKSDTGCEKETSRGLTDHEILSQAMVFIFAGYETSSSTLSFFFYNIATNPDTMKKLQEEIDLTCPDKAAVHYDALMSMDYLDAALNESLRLFPVVPRLERIGKKTVEIQGVTIPEGTVVVIPTFVLHRDPEYWPEPEEFHPERFSKENKDCVDPYVYMPFGAGPRNCIGMRFAQVAMKLAIVEILQRFDVSVCEETQVPLELSSGVILNPTKPIILRFSPRIAFQPSNTNNHSLI